jgi:hypothetical protein
MCAEPFAYTWIVESEDRADNLVLKGNRRHWNTARGPLLERVVYRNDLSAENVLELCCTTKGEMDIITEVSLADAQKVIDSEHAELVICDANRVLVGIFNRHPPFETPLTDACARKTLNLAIHF